MYMTVFAVRQKGKGSSMNDTGKFWRGSSTSDYGKTFYNIIQNVSLQSQYWLHICI